MYDIVIRGGDVVDGTGAPGAAPTSGSRATASSRSATIDGTTVSRGHASTPPARSSRPGFVDVHTHYDAQVFWDGALTPSPLHGVTTVLAGNCGFTIAPLSDDAADGDYLHAHAGPRRGHAARVAAHRRAVELDDDRRVLRRDRRPPRHQRRRSWSATRAIRRVVMGEESTEREANARRARRDAARCSAPGSRPAASASRRRGRARTTTPRATWCRRATRRATSSSRCARRVGEFEGTSLEFIPKVGPFEPWAVELMADMSAAAQRPLNWNVLGVNGKNLDDVRAEARGGHYAREHGRQGRRARRCR